MLHSELLQLSDLLHQKGFLLVESGNLISLFNDELGLFLVDCKLFLICAVGVLKLGLQSLILIPHVITDEGLGPEDDHLLVEVLDLCVAVIES